MKIIETQIMHGPNLWSIEHPRLIVLTVDGNDVQQLPADKKPALYKKAKKIIPDLQADDPGALVEAVAKAILNKADMPCDFSRNERSKEGHFKIIFSYTLEQAGIVAGEAAVDLVNHLLENVSADLEHAVAQLSAISKQYALGATSAYILHEAEKRGIPFQRFHNSSLFTLGYGRNQKMIRTAVADSTSGLGIEMAGNKEETKQLLAEAHVPVPKGLLVNSEEELEQAVRRVRFPIVTKPLDGNHGRGVTTQIHNPEQALFGFRIAQQISETVIVEEFVEGDDFRFLVIDYKLVAVAKRTPAMITGDGRATIQQLIDKENLNPDRGLSSGHVLAPIVVDTITEKILHEKNLTLQSVLPENSILYLKETANISAGGTAEDVTDQVHPFTAFMAERIARLFKLNICGIDLMTTDISAPLSRDTGAIIEVNAGPGIRMHTNPQAGSARNVASPIMDMLFPTPQSCRIPIVAITGTNGKTTTTRLMAHFAQLAGYQPGYTTTDGIYINGHLLVKGDCTGPVSARSVLFDPTVDFAVLECARGGILRAGLGFDQCDVSIITNISEDHLGLKGIYTLEDMLKVKAVVTRSTAPGGYAVLNAEDPLVYSLYDQLPCQVALFSLTTEHAGLMKLIKEGGVAAVLEDDCLVIYDGKKILVEQIDCVPLTHDGKAQHMIKNMLAATLAAYLCKIDLQVIQDGLRSFTASAGHTPGRMNLFQFSHCDLMIDYAHNVDGFREIKKYLDTLSAHKTGIIAVAGDRRDQDIRTIGQLAAEMFDEIIIRHDEDLRGRSMESKETLLLAGIHSVKPDMRVKIVPGEEDSIRYALQHVPKGGFILECAEKVHEVLALAKLLQEQEPLLK